MAETPRDWLIRKGGYFYRPDFCGYTTRKDQAGRYTEAEARSEAAVEPWHMKAIHEGEWPDTPKTDGTVSASTHTRAMEALREAREVLAEIRDGYLADQSAEQQFVWAQRRAITALSRIAAILKDEP
jgi:hypothetical protein